MCTPAAAMGIQAVGAVTSSYGAYQSGLAESNYYRYAAESKREEADLAIKRGEQESTLAQNEGAQQSKLLGIKQAELEGSQKATIGANMGGGSRSAADITADSFDKEKMDQLAVKYNADVQSWNSTEGAKLKAWSLGREAEGYDVAAGAAKSSGKTGAFNTLLSGAGQVANTWYLKNLYAPSTNKVGTVSGRRVPVAPPDYYKKAGRY